MTYTARRQAPLRSLSPRPRRRTDVGPSGRAPQPASGRAAAARAVVRPDCSSAGPMGSEERQEEGKRIAREKGGGAVGALASSESSRLRGCRQTPQGGPWRCRCGGRRVSSNWREGGRGERGPPRRHKAAGEREGSREPRGGRRIKIVQRDAFRVRGAGPTRAPQADTNSRD